MLINTGGGAYDPNDRNVYFIASNVERMKWGALQHDHLLVAINELNTESDYRFLRGWFSDGKKVLIDSGIYALAMEHAQKYGVSHDEGLAMSPQEIEGFDELWSQYVAVVGEHEGDVWGYIELDQGGRENKIKTRAKLEELGLRPIPVYHPLLDGWDYFDYLAERYDRICVGNVVYADRYTRIRLFATIWERKRKYPNLWIHLLGVTPNEWLNAYPIDSGDSSSWLSNVKWSGYKEKSDNAPFCGMSPGYKYLLGSDPDGLPGSRRAAQMAAYGSYMQQLNWKQHIKSLEELGAVCYPNLPS